MQQPPGFSNYPRGGGGYSRPPGVYFDTISTAFRMIQAQIATWILTSLVSIIIVGGLYALISGFEWVTGISRMGMGTMPDGKPTVTDFGAYGFGLLLQLLLGLPATIVGLCMVAGIAKMAIRQSAGEAIQMPDLFNGFQNIGSVAVAGLLVSLMTTLGIYCCCIPGIYLQGISAFSVLIASTQNMGPIDAIGESFSKLKPFAWAMAGLMIVAGFLTGIGVIACGVGLLFTFPIYGIVLGLTYASFFPQGGLISYGDPSQGGYGSPGQG